MDANTGEVLWSKDGRKDFSCTPPQWGFAGSPVITNGRVIVDIGVVVAMDKVTGKVIWKSRQYNPGYSTPTVFFKGPKRCVGVFNSAGLVILDLATGREVTRSPWRTREDVNAITPVVVGDKVFISSGYGAGCELLELGTYEPSVVWRTKRMSCQLATPILYDGHLYGISGDAGDGVLTCIDLHYGEVQWAHRDQNAGSVMSLTMAGGKLLVQGERGKLFVVRATPDHYSQLAEAQILDGTCWTTPVLSHGRIYCRNADGQLVCLDVRAGE
jgi:outer membrane protein assembly factor BamB